MLVAGLGTRLKPLTNDTPKCLIKVNETSPLETALNFFSCHGIEEVVLVTGYFCELINDEFGDEYRGMKLKYVINDKYEQTNNIYSLWLAKDHMNEDVIMMEGDIMIRKGVINRLVESEGDNLIVVSDYADWMDGLAIGINNGIVEKMVLTKDQNESFNKILFAKTVNLYRFSQEFISDFLLPSLTEAVTGGLINEFYEIVIKKAIEEESVKFVPVFVDPSSWIEIDDINDLNNAKKLSF